MEKGANFVGGAIGAIISVAILVWSIYVIVLELNHIGAWPFSVLGAG